MVLPRWKLNNGGSYIGRCVSRETSAPLHSQSASLKHGSQASYWGKESKGRYQPPQRRESSDRLVVIRRMPLTGSCVPQEEALGKADKTTWNELTDDACRVDERDDASLATLLGEA